MTVTYIGSETIGDSIPGVNAALVVANADLEAKIAALAAFSVSLEPPSIAAQLSLVADIQADLQAMLTLGISPPSLSVQFSAVLALLAQLNIQLGILLSLMNLLQTAGVHAYAYSGAANALGGEFSATLAGGFPGGAPTDATNALLLATTIPATWAALAQVFKVTP